MENELIKRLNSVNDLINYWLCYLKVEKVNENEYNKIVNEIDELVETKKEIVENLQKLLRSNKKKLCTYPQYINNNNNIYKK